MDCLEGMKNIPDKSIDLIVTDPPYNIGKAKWDKIDNYIEWMGTIFKECERILKDNGSFYFFHNDMPQIAQLMEWLRLNTKFVFKQFITWNKKFKGASNEGYLQGFIEVEGLRNYQKMAEYCLYYTFQDETGSSAIHSNKNCFRSVKDYLLQERAKLGMSTKQLIDKSADYLGKRNTAISHYFTDSQFAIPTEEVYKKYLQVIGKEHGAFQREYKGLREEYEGLREGYEGLREGYEGLRYTFNNQKSHHSVWNYEVAKKEGHITPKPTELIENILKHSSNENDVVLDCFMGSGTTAIACLNTDRQYIGFELDEGYYNIAQDRIKNHAQQLALL